MSGNFRSSEAGADARIILGLINPPVAGCDDLLFTAANKEIDGLT